MYRGTGWALGALIVAVLAMPSVAAADNGVIKGKVVFKGDASRFKRSKIKTAKDPNCKKSKKSIGSENVIINKKTDPMTLRNVMVSIEDGLGDFKCTPKTTPIVLDQVGCQYKPHIVAMMASQSLRIRNGDETNHNIHFLPKVNQEMNFSQPKKDMTRDVTLRVEDVFKVKCDVHPWMGAYIRVFDHPFFAVTGKDGTFEIGGLPPGKYVVKAWHEDKRFGEQTMTVEVALDETKQVDFTFEPK